MKHHIVQIVAIAVFSLAFASSSDARAQQDHGRGPSTAEERARAVKIAHQLESDPLGKDAKDDRAWVIQWIVDIPDITVNVCDEYFGKVPTRGHSLEITNQMIISSAAFMIEHPDNSKNEQAVALAGLQGAIKAYQAILKQDSDSRWAQMDKIIEMREKGGLDDFVADTRRKCAQQDEEPDPDTMHAQLSIPHTSGLFR